ncbi:MAG: hypothetical protein FWD33_02280 [Alphaproteobacteria bacterium]|nr:hypothetical protein [Alphaproteobacteria bacterium]
MLNLLKKVLIAALVVIAVIWAWEKFGYLLFQKTGGLTPESSLAEWNNSGATEREMIVRAILSEPARVSKVADCITIMARVSESRKMNVRDAVPLCISGQTAADHLRVFLVD